MTPKRIPPFFKVTLGVFYAKIKKCLVSTNFKIGANTQKFVAAVF
jgi:hypothetical protein